MQKIDLSLRTLVLVSWVDSNFSLGWHPADALTAKMPRAQTVGFVTYNDNEMIEVAGSIGADGGKLNPLSIPWISIESLEILRGPVATPPVTPGVMSAGKRPRFDDNPPEDLPETVESDADFRFRELQLELGEKAH